MMTVLIPARDEAAAVGGVVRRVGEALAREPHEVLVVDDGSSDATGRVAREAGARVLRLEGRGYGAAIKAGAREARGGLLALLDADGTYPEEALPALLAEVRSGARQAIGARPAFGPAEPLARSLVKAAFRLAVHGLGGLAVPDLNSGLRVLHTADVLALAPLLPERFSLSTTLTLAIAAAGGPLAFVSVDYRARTGRSKWRPVRDTWRMGCAVACGVGWLRQGRAPAALSAPGGLG